MTRFSMAVKLRLCKWWFMMMMCVCASNHKPDGNVLPGDSFDKAMLQMQKLQATRPAGREIYIVKEIPKKTRDLFETFKIPFPKKQIKD